MNAMQDKNCAKGLHVIAVNVDAKVGLKFTDQRAIGRPRITGLVAGFCAILASGIELGLSGLR
jgi:hypothetical protein